jgi:hypothetical protein
LVETEQTGGTLTGTAPVQTVSLLWSGGTMTGGGTTRATALMTLDGNPKHLADRTLINDGAGMWSVGDIFGGGTVQNYGTFQGEGTLQADVYNYGTLWPAGPGTVGTILGMTGFTHGGILKVDLGESADLLTANGVTLGGHLDLSAVTGFAQSHYTLITNTSPHPTNGTFAGLGEGAVVAVAGVRYQITYVGGSGNDVELHAIVSVGDYVWEDLNVDGKQAGGEPGIANAKVELMQGGQVVATTYSDLEGKYLFPIVRVGTYALTFTRPDGYQRFSPKDAGPDPTDSDADRSSGQTDPFTLEVGQDDLTRAAGMYRLGIISDWVWGDAASQRYNVIPVGNGIQEYNEGGVGDMVVRLLDAQGNILTSTVTNEYGGYQFIDLEPLVPYRVQFVLPENQVISTPPY